MRNRFCRADARPLARHRQFRPRPLVATDLRRPHLADDRRASRLRRRGLHRHDGRPCRRLFRRLDRPAADAHHRHFPRFPGDRPGACHRRGARPRHRQCRRSPSSSSPGPEYARVVRATTLVLREQNYVQAATRARRRAGRASSFKRNPAECAWARSSCSPRLASAPRSSRNWR